MDAYHLIPLVAAAVYSALFFVILVNRPWQDQHRLFTMYLAAATLWSLSDFLLRSDFFMEDKLLLFRLVTFFTIWWALQLYYFARSFLHLPGGFGTWFGYVSLVVFGILAALGYAPPGITVNKGVVDPVYGWWMVIYAGSILTLAGMGVYSLVKRLKILTDPRERNKIAYLIIAVGFLVAFGSYGMSPLSRGYPVTHVGALLSACILTYAVMKHELVSINSILRRGLGWVSLFVIGSAAYLLIFFLFHLLLGFELEVATLALATLAAATVAVFIYWLRPIFLGIVDQLFYKGTYSYRQALLGFSGKMGNIINLNELADEMLPAIGRALRTPQAKLLFEDMSTGDFTTQFTYPKADDKLNDELRFNPDNPIVAWLEKEAGPLDLRQIDNIPQFKGLWQVEKEKLAASKLAVLCPIKSRGKLVGILALGRKQSDSLYSQEDMEMVMSMASQAGIIIENARMFDRLKKQQLQVEQLLTQAILAQEDERQRISVDLHDSVAQWLVAASYGAQTCQQTLSGDDNDVARSGLSDVESTINKSLKELRRVVIGLRPPALDELGLSHALHQSLEELRADRLICKFSETGTPLRLPSAVEIAVYRVVQEALSNIRKHANASEVKLRLRFQEDKITVEIRDNGRGFDISKTLDSAVAVGHVGLLGMRQRAEMLGGDVRIKSTKDGGTTITLTLPVPASIEEG